MLVKRQRVLLVSFAFTCSHCNSNLANNYHWVNGKCETLQEGKTSVFLCKPETHFDFLNASMRCTVVIYKDKQTNHDFLSLETPRWLCEKIRTVGHD